MLKGKSKMWALQKFTFTVSVLSVGKTTEETPEELNKVRS